MTNALLGVVGVVAVHVGVAGALLGFFAGGVEVCGGGEFVVGVGNGGGLHVVDEFLHGCCFWKSRASKDGIEMLWCWIWMPLGNYNSVIVS